MSGIFGIYNLNGRPVDDGALAAMQRAMANRYSAGGDAWRGGAIGLGHRMLRATSELLCEALPARSRSGKHVLTATARLDNRDDLFAALNVPVADRSAITDSDVILLAYEKWDIDCPGHLLGDWSFAIWDSGERRLFVARDQFGHGGLYYYQHRDTFVFASQLTAVLAAPGVPREFNPSILTQLIPGISRDETTAYRHVVKLTPGRSVTVTQRQIRHEQYWHPGQGADIRFKRDEEYVEAFREIFSEAVRCRLRSDSTVGVTLSGGLDSGSTAALAAQHLVASGQRLTGITSVPQFDTKASDNPTQIGDERPYVELICRHCTNIDVRYVTAAEVSPLQGMRRMLAACSDPLLSPSNALWLCGIMEEAGRCGIGTLLTGQAGNYTVSWAGNRDEYLSSLLRSGRILKYASEVRAWKQANQASLAKTLTNQVARSVLPGQWVRTLKRGRAQNHPLPLNSEFLRSLSPLGSAPSDATGCPSMHPKSALRKLSGLMRTDCNSAWSELGAACGITITAPTIDVRVIEFCLGIPQDQYTRDGQRKLLIRRAMKALLPQKVLWNERKGRQAGDIIHRVRAHRDEFDALLTELRSSARAMEILDLPRMNDVFEKIQTDINPELSQRTSSVLLKGLMIGLFLQRFEARPEISLQPAA